MPHHIKRISINKPCTQPWGNMVPIEGGRYCNSCKKRVTDFTGMSDDDVLKILSATDNACGRFGDVQLKVLNHSLQTQQNVFPRRLGLALSLISLFTIGSSKGKQIHRTITQTFVTPEDISHQDTLKRNVVEGVVKEDSTNTPLPGATVKFKPSNVSTTTGENGKFKLYNVAETDTVVIEYIGYRTVELPVKSLTLYENQIMLRPLFGLNSDLTVIAGGVFVKRSLFWRIWYHLKKLI